MTAREIFAEQLATSLPYTSAMLHEAATSGHFVEGSEAYLYRLAHVGERMIFVLVQRGSDTQEPDSIRTLNLVVENYFETEIDDVFNRLTKTHDHTGYTINHIPRFMFKRKEKENGPT